MVKWRVKCSVCWNEGKKIGIMGYHIVVPSYSIRYINIRLVLIFLWTLPAHIREYGFFFNISDYIQLN